MIVLEKATLRRGSERLLDQVDLTIQPGRKVGVVGRNGSGKSSLFALLRDELPLDGGSLKRPAGWRIAHMAQEIEALERRAIDHVLDGDTHLRRIEAELAEAEAQGRGDCIGRLHADYEAHDGYAARSRAERLLAGLGFASDEVEQPVSHFSGGWRIRLSLARALMQPSDLLLLDEPTNHLDIDAIYWLEGWLQRYPGTLMLISHDRDFLDQVVDTVIHLEGGGCTAYRGHYSDFERQRAERLMQQQALYQKQQRRIGEIHRFVSRFRAKATKARQAQSRLKELERMEQLAPAHLDTPFDFDFRKPEALSDPLLQLRDASIGYDDGKAQVSGIELHIGAETRIGLLGPNGAGKSTLLKTLAGRLPLLTGQRIEGEHLRIGYFAQHQVEALDPQASPLLHLQRLDPQAREQSLRDFLGGFDFQGERALTPIAPFSGGEKARLALALIVWQRPNLLLLDEPTNHLDLEMRHALTVALQSYQGALVVVAHDRHLLRNTVDQYWSIHAGTATPFDGTVDDYHAWLSSSPAPEQQPEPTAGQGSDRSEEAMATNRKEQRRQAAAERQREAPLRKRLKQLEAALEELEQQRSEIEEALADPSLYSAENKARLAERLQQQQQTRQQIDTTEAEWLALSEALEA